MRKPIRASSLPAVRLTEEFFNPKFGNATVADCPVPKRIEYPTTAATISTSFEGSMYRMASFSAFLVTFSKLPASPLCEAPCSKAFRQASLYVGPALTHRATIKGVSVIGVE